MHRQAGQTPDFGSRTPPRAILCLAACLIAIASLSNVVQAQAPSDPNEIFDMFDTNSDGKIDRTEFDVNKVQVISVFDANRNGQLERDETRMSDEAFNTADQDSDGAISGYEFVESPLGKFEAFDSDGDGLITREEFRAVVEDLRG
jgi:Ca2+-binding EF-hand superfamily protein